MSLIAIVVIIGALAFLGTYAAAYALAGRLSSLEQRFRQLRAQPTETAGWRGYVDKSQHLLQKLGKMIPRSPNELSRMERRLIQAGYRRRDGATLFVGFQLALGVTFVVILGVTGRLWEHFFLYAFISMFLGAALPDIWLALKGRARRRAIQKALPDALDLEVVCVEAGLALDQSLMRVGKEIHRNYPEFSSELRLMNLELNAGKSRTESLRNLADRTDVDDLRALVAVLIQSDRFGTSIADSLRVYSDAFRTKRKQRAEEQAAKMGVKMIPPLFFFILPATFAVVVGPAVIRIAMNLLPILRVPQ
ncbi:MAG TPA: type II secretion system F family protein [Vicinamibacteria bacterium]|nr:type II secretion system F family protein [Vicinamibacteria bacterium]